MISRFEYKALLILHKENLTMKHPQEYSWGLNFFIRLKVKFCLFFVKVDILSCLVLNKILFLSNNDVI